MANEINVGKSKIELVLRASDSIIYAGGIWDPEDNYDGGTNSFNSPITYNSLTDVRSNVNTSKPEVYIIHTKKDSILTVA